MSDEHFDYQWPADTPPNCPPVGAVPADGDFFRLVKGDAVTPADFARPIDQPRKPPLARDNCKAYALSLYADHNDAHLARQIFGGFRNRRIARGSLQPHMGKTLRTPSKGPVSAEGQVILNSHHSWWMAATYTDEPGFVVVAEP